MSSGAKPAAQYVEERKDAVSTPAGGVVLSDDVNKEHIEQVHVDEVAEEPLGRWGRFKQHYKRWWWAYTIGHVIFLIIFLPCLFLAIMPRGIQDYVDGQNVPITRLYLSNPKPDALTWTLVAWLKVFPGITVKMDTVDLRLVDTSAPHPRRALATLTMPGRKLRGYARLSLDNQEAPITYMDGIQTLFNNAVVDDDVLMSFRSNPVARLGKIKGYKLKFNKDVPTKGFNQFKGARIRNPRFLISAEKDGTNFVTDMMLPNQSPVSLELGNVTYYLKSYNITIGTAKMSNLNLQTGNATYPVRAQLNFSSLFKNMPQLLQQQAAWIQEGNMQMNTTGIGPGGGVVVNGQNIDYYAISLAHLNLPAEIPMVEMVNNTMAAYRSGDDNNFTALLAQIRPALANIDLARLVQDAPILENFRVGGTNASASLL